MTHNYDLSCETDDRYWDCSCKAQYIQPKTVKQCPKCKTRLAWDVADSRVTEIEQAKREGWLKA